MKFNPNDYETVKSRKKRFYTDHPDGRIMVEALSAEPLEYAMFRVEIFLDRKAQVPTSSGYAMEIRDKELSRRNDGSTYASVNYSSWLENCEESAVGRALDNAGYSGNLKCSREEMEKAARMEEIEKSKNVKSPVKTMEPPKQKYTGPFPEYIEEGEVTDPYEEVEAVQEKTAAEIKAERKPYIDAIGDVMKEPCFTKEIKDTMKKNIKEAKTIEELQELVKVAKIMQMKKSKENTDAIY